MTRIFDVFFDLCLYKRFSKQSKSMLDVANIKKKNNVKYVPINNHELLNIQACSFHVVWNWGYTQSLVVSCKYWVVPLVSTRVSGYSQIILLWLWSVMTDDPAGGHRAVVLTRLNPGCQLSHRNETGSVPLGVGGARRISLRSINSDVFNEYNCSLCSKDLTSMNISQVAFNEYLIFTHLIFVL